MTSGKFGPFTGVPSTWVPASNDLRSRATFGVMCLCWVSLSSGVSPSPIGYTTLTLYGYTHTSGGTGDNFNSGVKVICVQDVHLDFGDFFELLSADFTNFVDVRFA